MKKIEEIRRALCVARYGTDSICDREHVTRCGDCVKDIRAVLQTLREPSPEMEKAGSIWCAGPKIAANTWRAMVDKLLDER